MACSLMTPRAQDAWGLRRWTYFSGGCDFWISYICFFELQHQRSIGSLPGRLVSYKRIGPQKSGGHFGISHS